jgi:clan AA aspartic protease
MSIVYTEITLKNAGDAINVGRGLVQEKDVRSVTVSALVDTGATTLVISEALRRKLGLAIDGEWDIELADGSSQGYGVTEPVRIQWENRKADCNALVMPDSSEVLLGAIPLEMMDLAVIPSRQELAGAHGDRVVGLAK